MKVTFNVKHIFLLTYIIYLNRIFYYRPSMLGVSSSSSHAGGTSRQLGGGEAEEQSSQPATTWPGRL
jgi:hypothetical protein